jgi:enolase
MSKIKNIIAREIKDSRGNPTVEVEIETGAGSFIASVPSGASTGENEALELRDADGKGVQNAIKNINEIIALKLKGKDPSRQQEIDKLMIDLDGTENKSKLGANAILGVSMAVCKAGAEVKKIPLYKYIADLTDTRYLQKMPLAMFNLLEGGVHTDKKTNTAVQEFMVIPQKETFAENLVLCNKVFENLKQNIEKNFGEAKIGFEGGFASPFSKTEQALYALKSSIGDDDSKIALDVAASEFFKNGKYNLEDRELTRAELLEFYEDLIKRFPIISIEDPYEQSDWNGFESILQEMGDKILIVGDDLTTTNIIRIKEAHNKKACNGVILKLNQIGTVTETIEASNLSKSFGWKTIVSHRSGETMDDFIADLAVGTGADFIKSGSPAKPERMVKYSRLLEIEDELNKK